MARKSKSEHSSNLASALKFVGMTGAEYCHIGSNLVTAFTDQIAIGFPIEEDLNAQAHIKNLYKSLCKSNEQTAITQLDLHKLHVNSGNLQVYIPCIEKINHIEPDKKVYEINESFVNNIEKVLPLVSAFGEHISMKTILIFNGCFFATNRFCIVQLFHGLNLPFLNISKKFCDLILKSKKKVSNLGYSENSITVYFEDESWIMGKISKEEWINPFSILDKVVNFNDFSLEMFKAIENVSSFSTSGKLYSKANCLQSHPEALEGASYPILGLPDGGIYGVKDLAFLAKNAQTFGVDGLRLYFLGNNLRGCISSREI